VVADNLEIALLIVTTKINSPIIKPKKISLFPRKRLISDGLRAKLYEIIPVMRSPMLIHAYTPRKKTFVVTCVVA